MIQNKGTDEGTSLSIEVMYSWYLSESVVSLPLGALCGVYDIENALLVRSYTTVLFATIA